VVSSRRGRKWLTRGWSRRRKRRGAAQPPAVSPLDRELENRIKFAQYGQKGAFAMRNRIVFAVLLSMVVLIVSTTIASPATAASPAQSKSCSYQLTPQIRLPQYPGQQHLNFLYAPVAWNGKGRYVIVNTYTRIGYQWAFHGNFSGRARFGVPTSYTLLNPHWTRDRWVIVFSECPK
jgi:hypothetical protein